MFDVSKNEAQINKFFAKLFKIVKKSQKKPAAIPFPEGARGSLGRLFLTFNAVSFNSD